MTETVKTSDRTAIDRLAHWSLAREPAYRQPLALAQAKLLVLDSIGCAFAAHATGAVDGVIAALDTPAAADPDWKADAPNPSTSGVAPWRILNLGAGRREPLMRYISVLEDALGMKATLNMMPVQDGDVARTEADVTETRTALGYAPSTPIDVGVQRFVDWYRDFYGV